MGRSPLPTLSCSAGLLAEDGITTVVATPHQLGRYDRENSAPRIRQSIAELTAILADEQIPLDLLPGGDIRVDERLERFLDSGEVATVADSGRYLLLELPHELFVDPVAEIEMLSRRGLQAIMTHPEALSLPSRVDRPAARMGRRRGGAADHGRKSGW